MTEKTKTGVALALILLLALAARVWLDLWRSAHPGFIPGDGYPEIAQNILTGVGFAPTPLRQWCFRTPGYPLFIAAVWSLVPTSARYTALLAAQAVLSVVTCGLLYVIANKAFGRRSALAGAFLFALSPSVIVDASRPITETLYLFWIVLTVLTAMRLYKSAQLLTAIGSGIIWGVAGLTRPEATVLLAPLFFPILMARHIRPSIRFSLCTATILGKIVAMAPWVARNYAVYGTFVLHVPLGGLGLFAATYPYPPRLGRYATVPKPSPITETREYREITGPFWDPDFLQESPGLEDRLARCRVEGMPVPHPSPTILVVRTERDILEVDRQLAAEALRNIKNHKLLQLYNMLRHLYALWGRPAAWWAIDELPAPLKLVWRTGYVAFMVLFVFGLRIAWKRGKIGPIPLSWLMLMLCHALFFVVFNAEPRYKVTSAIFLCIFSGVGLAALLPSRDRKTATGNSCSGVAV
jgi:hypothetical protein